MQLMKDVERLRTENAELSPLKAELEKLRSDQVELQSTLKEQSQSAKLDYDKLLSEKQRLSEDTVKLTKEIDRLKTELSLEDGAKALLKQEWEEAVENERVERVKLVNTLTAKLEVVTEEHESQSVTLEAQCQRYREKCEDNHCLTNDIQRLEVEKQQLNDAVMTVCGERDKALQDLKDVCYENTLKVKNLEETISGFNVDSKKVGDVEKERSKLRVELENTGKAVRDLEEEQVTLLKKLATMETLVGKLQDEKTNFEQDILEFMSTISGKKADGLLQAINSPKNTNSLALVAEFLKTNVLPDLRALQGALGLSQGQLDLEMVWSVIEELKAKDVEREALQNEVERLKHSQVSLGSRFWNGDGTVGNFLCEYEPR